MANLSESQEEKIKEIWEKVEGGKAGEANWEYKVEKLKALWGIEDLLKEISDLQALN